MSKENPGLPHNMKLFAILIPPEKACTTCVENPVFVLELRPIGLDRTISGEVASSFEPSESISHVDVV